MTVLQHASPARGSSGATLFSMGPAAEHGVGLAFAPTRARCTAWHWRPEGADAAPCLVLAYGDSGGIHVRQTHTGETHLLPVPEGFCFH